MAEELFKHVLKQQKLSDGYMWNVDLNADGRIHWREMFALIKQEMPGLTEQQIKVITDTVDFDADGWISSNEFRVAMLHFEVLAYLTARIWVLIVLVIVLFFCLLCRR